MLDEQLNVYLIEVNTNPALDTSCPLLTKIITPLVENIFKYNLCDLGSAWTRFFLPPRNGCLSGSTRSGRTLWRITSFP